MGKRIYVTPEVDKLVFDYRNTVTASGGGDDASHCNFGRNPGKCGSKGYGNCDGWNDNPGSCTAIND